jgi:hypothetical protein
MTIQKEVETLQPILSTLRSDLSNYKKQFTWDNGIAAQMQRDIDHLNIALNGLKGVIAWIAASLMHQTLQSFEAYAYPREQVILVLEKDYPLLTSFEFTRKMRSSGIPKISDDNDLLRYYIPFLNSPTVTDQVYLAIFGNNNPGNNDEKLLIRQLEILSKTEHPGITRAERLEFEANGFTRSNISNFMQVLQQMYAVEKDNTFRELLIDYFNQLSNDRQVRSHLELI